MECGISLFAGNQWMALLTWIAFAAVATFVATILYARRGSSGTNEAPSAEIERLSARLEEMSGRLEALERAKRDG